MILSAYASLLSMPATESEQAAHPHDRGGPLIGRLWVKESAKTNDAALDLLAPSPDEDILAIGFGPGRTLGLLAIRGARVTGVEVSEEMIRLVGRRNRGPVGSEALTLEGPHHGRVVGHRSVLDLQPGGLGEPAGHGRVEAVEQLGVLVGDR